MKRAAAALPINNVHQEIGTGGAKLLLIKHLRQALRDRPTRKQAGSASTLAASAFDLAE
jgi:hypothetical protein